MRAVLVGASAVAVSAARLLLRNGHEVVLVDEDEDKVDRLSEEIDCGFVVGDGSRPAILREVSPENTDFLFCLSNSDQDNIIAGLMGRKLGFGRIIVQITDSEFESICTELDIDDVIVPDRQIGESLANIVEGEDTASLLPAIKQGLGFFAFVVTDAEAGPLSHLELPSNARVIAITRETCSLLAGAEMELEEGDEVLLITEETEIDGLRDRFKNRG